MSLTFKYLTLSELLYRKLIETFGRLRPGKVAVTPIEIKGYRLLKDLTGLSSGVTALIGVFVQTTTNQTVFIKKYAFKCRGLRYASLLNELAIMQLLHRHKLGFLPTYQVKVPKLLKVIRKQNELTIISEYAPGELLESSSARTKVTTLKTVYLAMKEINRVLTPVMHRLPRRRSIILAASFMYFWMWLMLKDAQAYQRNFKLLKYFYLDYVASLGAGATHGLVHRDLHSRNILLKDDLIIVTDWEGAVVMDAYYDLAMLGRLYSRELTADQLLEILKPVLLTTKDKHRYMFLTIFHIVQTLGLDQKNAISYSDTLKFTRALFSIIRPSLLEKNSRPSL